MSLSRLHPTGPQRHGEAQAHHLNASGRTGGDEVVFISGYSISCDDRLATECAVGFEEFSDHRNEGFFFFFDRSPRLASICPY